MHGDSQRIDAEISTLLRTSGVLDPEPQASVARYCCVLASGFLESSCREILLSYAKKRADGSVTRYVERRLAGFRDPNTEKILQLAGDFAPDKRLELERSVDDKLKDGIDSICANRNSIAHGRRSGISLAQVKDYYDTARQFMTKPGAVFPAR